MPTIFDSVVTKENDHTNLLRNLLERDSKVAASILSLLIERPVADSEAATFEYQTQQSFRGPDGREIPDILVTGNKVHCIIEAKVDPYLYLTDAQQCGYKNSFPGSDERHLTFLVPNDWKYPTEIETVRTALEGSGIRVSCHRWPELIDALETASKEPGDEVLNEAVKFWKGRFELDKMTPDERLSLSTWPVSNYSAIRKLQKTIEQARKLFTERGFETELETSGIEYYGFYIKRGRYYLLWVGIWTKAPTPLSFAYHLTKSIWMRPRTAPEMPLTVDNHHLWKLESETWDNPENIYSKVRSVVDSGWPTP